jgi:hypothetical protein
MKVQNYTEGVGEFQPRVALWQPWGHDRYVFLETLKGFIAGETLSGLQRIDK